LFQSSKHDAALGQLANLYNILQNSVNAKYHSSVFIQGSRPKLSGQQVDSVSSGNYASFADALLADYNPQTGEDQAQDYVPPVVKRHRPAVLSYAQAASPTPAQAAPVQVAVVSTAPTFSSVTQDDMEKLFATFSQKCSGSMGSTMTIQALEQQVQQTSLEIHEVKASFQTQIQTVISQTETMSNNMEKLTDTISRQNFVIACIQQEFKQTMSDLYGKLGFAPPACAEGVTVTSTAPQPAASSAWQVGGTKA
jgi:hypothetical protein